MNASPNDQLAAEIAELEAQPMTIEERAQTERLIAQGWEIMLDSLALKSFERMLLEPST